MYRIDNCSRYRCMLRDVYKMYTVLRNIYTINGWSYRCVISVLKSMYDNQRELSVILYKTIRVSGYRHIMIIHIII